MEALQETATWSKAGGNVDLTPDAAKRQPLRPTSSSRKKRQASDSSSTSKRARVEDDDVLVKSCDIEARIRMIFPDDDVIGKPCMSARLFACFTLISELPQSVESNELAPYRVTRRGHCSKLPIISLLQALVLVESSSLGQTVERKTVQFSAYEGSATRPPRDSVLGSHIPRHININAMVAALELANKMLCASSIDKVEALNNLCALSVFLEKVEHIDEGKSLRQVCAKSMPFQWVPQRFQKAARLYQRDIQKLCQCLENNQNIKEADVQLNLERKLADSLGRAIRYHLRRFFNSIYGAVTEYPDIAESAFKRRSRIHEKLRMTFPSWYCVGPYSAVAEGSVSSVFATAIETIDREFGIDTFQASEFQVPIIPTVFCQSEASRRGIGGRNKTVPDEFDLQTIMSETRVAQGFLAGVKACRFVIELLNWPGVDEEIARLGGWSIIEQCAKEFHQFRLERVSPQEAHFVLLSDINQLRERVQLCYDVMEHAMHECTAALNDQWERFDCDNTKKIKALPAIGSIRELLMDGLKIHMFPTIAKPEIDTEDLSSTATDTSNMVLSVDDEKENCRS